MTTVEEHKEIIKEFIDDINEKIRTNQLTERQKIVGFSTSEASTNLFALLLHSKKIVEPSYNINHRFFASLKIAESRFKFDFPEKKKLLNLLVKQEEYRIKLCYGKKKESSIVDSSVKNLFEIKEIIEKSIEEENE